MRLIRTLEGWRTELVADWRQGGWRLTLRRRGWKVLLGVVAFYLVRDLLLYVVLPLGLLAALAR